MVEGSTRAVGRSVPRVEDARVLTGRGRYVGDIQLPNMAFAAFVRSSYAHAEITSIDITEALAIDGVLDVIIGDDVAAVTAALRPAAAPAALRYGEIYALAVKRALFVGDPVAVVIACDRYVAEDACAAVIVEYEPLDPVLSFADTADVTLAPLYKTLGSHIAYELVERGDGGADKEFATADHVIGQTFTQHRIAQNPIETRGGVASYDPAFGELIYYASSQSPHYVKSALAESLHLPVNSVTVINADIGGSFGQKIGLQREDVAIALASVRLGRPVKWIEDRTEHLHAAGHARDDRWRIEAAVSSDGIVSALRGEVVMNCGAYPSIPHSRGPTLQGMLRNVPGPYRMTGVDLVGKLVHSNKCTYNSYRGPWAMETWTRERLLDVVARELGIDPAEIRRRNLSDGEPGARLATGPSIAGIQIRQTLEQALDIVDYDALRVHQGQLRDQGRLRGIGVACFIESAPGPNPGPGRQRARAAIESDGSVTVFTTETPSGQGHETTLAQVAADEFGVEMGRIRVRHGDTRTVPYAIIGSAGSRGSSQGTAAVVAAVRKLKADVLETAAQMLEAAPADLEIQGDQVCPRGTPSISIGLAEVAAAMVTGSSPMTAGRVDPAAHTAGSDVGEGGWSGGTHICHVELDIETGRVDILRYVVVEDCGAVINPAIVAGQIRGGIAQGIGEVLFEHAIYSENGTLLTATYMDYLLPTAVEIPEIEIYHVEPPPSTDGIPYRGVGEGGMLVAPAAVTNAVEDALAHLGVRICEQYLPPSRVLELAGIIPASAAS